MKNDPLALAGALVLVVLPIVALAVLVAGPRPETRLLGEWREVSWSYEKVDDPMGSGTLLGQELRNEISQGLVIHRSETWRFNPGSALVLQKNGERNDTLQWALKGHGRMLQLVFGDKHQEVYKLKQLTDDEMVLQFNNDMIARGVVSIVFKRST